MVMNPEDTLDEVVLYLSSEDEVEKIREWLEKNCQHSWWSTRKPSRISSQTYVYIFESEEDAFLFALRFS